jgi:hypothetical protein
MIPTLMKERPEVSFFKDIIICASTDRMPHDSLVFSFQQRGCHALVFDFAVGINIPRKHVLRAVVGGAASMGAATPPSKFQGVSLLPS